MPSVVLSVLRLLGWRYSPTRNAWVHRLAGGRRGPVFRDHVRESVAAPPVDVHQIDRGLAPPFAADRPALPRRGAPVPPTEVPSDRSDTIDLTEPAAPPHLTAIAGDDASDLERPRVDCRPPRRDLPGTYRSAKPSLRVG